MTRCIVVRFALSLSQNKFIIYHYSDERELISVSCNARKTAHDLQWKERCVQAASHFLESRTKSNGIVCLLLVFYRKILERSIIWNSVSAVFARYVPVWRKRRVFRNSTAISLENKLSSLQTRRFRWKCQRSANDTSRGNYWHANE